MSTTTPIPSAEAMPPQTDQPSAPVAGCCGRRAVLRAAGLVALSGGAVALAACSAGSSASAPSTAASPAEASASRPDGTAVAISAVAVGGGVVVDQRYVVTQPASGEFKAFSAICTHQGCPVGSVEDGAIICPCHLSHFDITTGAPVSGPAQEPLPAVAFTTSGDSIVVTG